MTSRPAALALAPAALAAALLLAAPAVADPPELVARRLAHLFGYVAADYPAAVSAGEVVSPFELEEQLRLLAIAERLAAGLEAGGHAAGLAGEVRALRARVEAKGPEVEILAGARALEARVVRALRIDRWPAAVPDKERGRALFVGHCAPCHGPIGRGDGPRARELNPPPVSFLDPTVMEALSPARVASAVRFGIDGTAMAGFPTLSEEELWDLGFRVMALGHTPREAPRTPEHTLAELALRTDGELLDGLHAAGAAPHEIGSMLAELRSRAPFDAAAPPGPRETSRGQRAPSLARGQRAPSLARVRGELFRARELLLLGDRDAARDAVARAHAGGVRGAGARVEVIDPRLAAEIDERLLALRGRFAGEAEAALARDLDVAERRIAAAQLALAGAPPLGHPVHGMPAPAREPAALEEVGRGAAAGARRAVPLIAGLLGIALVPASRRLRIATAVAVGLVGALDLAAAGIALAERGWAGIGGLAGVVVLAAGLGGIALGAARRRRPAGGTPAPHAVVALAAVALTGRAVWDLQVAGVLPAHALGFVGTPLLGVRPSIEACAAQIIAGVIGALSLRRAAR